MPEVYAIKIKGQLDDVWSTWFADLTVLHPVGGDTLLYGLLPDQAALYGLLERLRDLNLTLLALACGTAAVHAASSSTPGFAVGTGGADPDLARS